MSYATIMVYVDAEATSREQIEVAADLAQKFNATLIGVSALLTRIVPLYSVRPTRSWLSAGCRLVTS
jgi:hypothetical protein